MKGKIVLIPFPFTDLTSAKLRPALVLYEGDSDVVVAFISSRLTGISANTSVLLLKHTEGFDLTGLKVDSVIRLDKVATISKKLILGELGEISGKLIAEVNDKICNTLKI